MILGNAMRRVVKSPGFGHETPECRCTRLRCIQAGSVATCKRVNPLTPAIGRQEVGKAIGTGAAQGQDKTGPGKLEMPRRHFKGGLSFSGCHRIEHPVDYSLFGGNGIEQWNRELSRPLPDTDDKQTKSTYLFCAAIVGIRWQVFKESRDRTWEGVPSVGIVSLATDEALG